MAKICLISPSHPSANPRLVKEADALCAAGHDVHAVTARYFPPLDAFDAEIATKAKWVRHVVDWTPARVSLSARVIRRVARACCGRIARAPLLFWELVHQPTVHLLARAAGRVKADLYIGHCLGGLAAAGRAAEAAGAILGFDAEDFHPAETTEAATNPIERRSIHALESHWLPRCAHLTASSPLIADAYARTYGIAKPLCVLNVFPLEAIDSRNTTPASTRPKLYWFSQTIGPGRGLEQLAKVLARMQTPTELCLRGFPQAQFVELLQLRSRESSGRFQLTVLPVAPPGRMIAVATGFDLGLCIEESDPYNRDICLTNKVFTFLQAGIPLLLTPTRAQSAFALEIGAAGVVADLYDAPEAARRLDAFLADEPRRRVAGAEARQLAETLFNWDLEQHKLCDAVRHALRVVRRSR